MDGGPAAGPLVATNWRPTYRE